jgi:hypothetical protein
MSSQERKGPSQDSRKWAEQMVAGFGNGKEVRDLPADSKPVKLFDGQGTMEFKRGSLLTNEPLHITYDTNENFEVTNRTLIYRVDGRELEFATWHIIDGQGRWCRADD